MTSNINYKSTLFKQSNLIPIRGKPMLETLHKLWNKIKANANYVYSNILVGGHGHLVIVLTEVKYALVCPTPFA